MVISEVRAQYRDADTLLFHTVVKKVEIIYGDGDPEQSIEYRDGWIIPPEWEFMSQKWTYKRKPVQEMEYHHDNKVQLLDGEPDIITEKQEKNQPS